MSFHLYPGEVLGLLGENGVGKTTLCGILASLHPATGGAVYWQGKPITQHLMAYRAIIGYCPQSQHLADYFTLTESLYFQARAYGLSAAAAQTSITKWLEKLGLAQYAHAHPSTLSGGYKQRFLIARALVHNPKIVLLDEPTVGLDPQARIQLWDCIETLREESVAVILTTHYLDEAERLSDRICMLDQGKVKALGKLDQLHKQYGTTDLEQLFLSVIKN